MNPNSFSTPRDLLRYAVTRFNAAKLFFGHGSAEAFDEAAYLILHTLKLPLDKLDPFLDARLLNDEVLQVLAVIERRAVERVPAAYITNEAWLGTYPFYVDERVLVPRSFIAELIPQRFSPWVADPDAVENVLELCTGSGCLAIMLADAFDNAVVDAVDISKDALAVAEHNIREYKLEGRVNPIESDLYENVPFKKYDLIVSNPPYVNADSMAKLPPEYMREPQIALAGGQDGMDLVRKIVKGAADYLTPEGLLIVEIGNEREYAEAAFGHLGLTWLTTSAGDDAVFLLTAEQIAKQQQ
jgi:ribosomal protein L3 glutamine methyltransferase